jgi:hypothetical protein
MTSKSREGAGLAFGGKKAQAIAKRMAQLREEQARTGRISLFDTQK